MDQRFYSINWKLLISMNRNKYSYKVVIYRVAITNINLILFSRKKRLEIANVWQGWQMLKEVKRFIAYNHAKRCNTTEDVACNSTYTNKQSVPISNRQSYHIQKFHENSVTTLWVAPAQTDKEMYKNFFVKVIINKFLIISS